MTDVKIVNIVEFGQQTIEKQIAHFIMNKVFIQIEVYLQNVLVKRQENTNLNLLPLTSVSSVWSRGAFGLNLPIQTTGQFVHDGILLIPPHTPNIKCDCAYHSILDEFVTDLYNIFYET